MNKISIVALITSIFIFGGFIYFLNYKKSDELLIAQINANSTIILVFVTALYVIFTYEILTVNKDNLNQLNKSMKKPRIEIIAKNYLHPIAKEAEIVIEKLEKKESIFQIILVPNKNVSKDLKLEIIDALNFFTSYKLLKDKNHIDPNYPDETLIERFGNFDFQICEIEKTIYEINNKAILFSELVYSLIEDNYLVEGTGGISNEVRRITQKDCIFLKIIQKLFDNPFLYCDIHKNDGSIKTHQEIIEKQLVFNDRIIKNLDNKVNQFYLDHQKELDDYRDQIDKLIPILHINLKDIPLQIDEWEKEWIRNYNIIVEEE